MDDFVRVHSDRKGRSTSTHGGVEATRAQFGQQDHPGAIAEPHHKSDAWEYGYKEALAVTDKFRMAVHSKVCADASGRGGHRRHLRVAMRGGVQELQRVGAAEKLTVGDGTPCTLKRKHVNNRHPLVDETILGLS